jgi:dTDP-4-amino-4,6-dideoxygalactose transaminase
MKKVNFYNISKLNKKYEKNFIKNFKKINKAGRYVIGDYVKKFETSFANYCNAKYCVAVGNCLDAIKLSFMAYKILGKLKNGDEVLVPANTYIASILGITSVNLKPIFVEPEPETFNISVENIKKSINKKTKAILVVDLYGHPADLFAIKKIAKKKNLKIIEDAAQSCGARINNKMIGSISDTTCFSFFPGKNLGAFGDGGAVTTNNKKLYNIIKSLRNYGESVFENLKDRKYKNIYKGVNSRMDEIQAAILIDKLKDYSKYQKIRKKIANFYLKNIKNSKIILPKLNKNVEHAWHLFVVKCKFRDKLKKFLETNKIETMIHYPLPPHKQIAFEEFNKKNFHTTEKIYKEILSLPIFPTLKQSEILRVVKVINKF